MKETKTMWAAHIDYKGKVIVSSVVVIWTKARTINKSTNTKLFYTKREALQALSITQQDKIKKARQASDIAFGRWITVIQALEECDD